MELNAEKMEVNNNEMVEVKKPQQKRTAQSYFVNHYKNLPENKGKPKLELAKTASELWNDMNAIEKERFIALADKDKIRYQNEMAAYKSNNGGKRTRAAKRVRREKDPAAPKKGTPAYFFYAKAHRQEVRDAKPDLSMPEVNKTLSEMWKNAPQLEKDIYFDLAAKDKKRYLKEKIEYEKKGESDNKPVGNIQVRTNIFKRTKSETSVSNDIDVGEEDEVVEEEQDEMDS